MKRILTWLEDRLHMGPEMNELLYHPVPKRTSWWDYLGFAALFVFVSQAASGILLSMQYQASAEAEATGGALAYESIKAIMSSPFGALVRGMHYWGANAMVVIVAAHLLRVFFVGAYKKPREATWVAGVFLLLWTIGFAFTGYLLPWDNQAYWATVVGTAVAEHVPFIGHELVRLMRGGDVVSGATLNRFYGIHMLVLPVLTAVFVAFHMMMVQRLGMTEVEEALPESYKKRHKPGDTSDMPPGFAPFFPDTVFNMTVVVFGLGLGLLGASLLFPAPLGEPADPLNKSDYQPVPVWYFFSVYEALKYFPPKLDTVGMVWMPLIAVAVLAALPFFDRNPNRFWKRRPVAMSTALVVTVAVVALTYMGWDSTRTKALATGPSKEHPGFKQDVQPIFQAKCLSCHSAAAKSGGLDLTSHGGLMAGGKSGPAVTPGKPDESLLIKALTGTAGQTPQMPLGGQPLDQTHIDTIRNWIRDGAPNN